MGWASVWGGVGWGWAVRWGGRVGGGPGRAPDLNYLNYLIPGPDPRENPNRVYLEAGSCIYNKDLAKYFLIKYKSQLPNKPGLSRSR